MQELGPFAVVDPCRVLTRKDPFGRDESGRRTWKPPIKLLLIVDSDGSSTVPAELGARHERVSHRHATPKHTSMMKWWQAETGFSRIIHDSATLPIRRRNSRPHCSDATPPATG
jgi:hypothetical protein